MLQSLVSSGKKIALFLWIIFFSSPCLANIYVQKHKENIVSLDLSKSIGTSTNSRQFLGVHSFWWEYSGGLINPERTQPDPLVLNFFSKTRGINRFGGGANEVPWNTCAGSVSERKPVIAAPWTGAITCRFGLKDYFKLMASSGVNGSWLIANISGINYSLWDQRDLKSNIAQGSLYRKENDPAVFKYWELGNELERGAYKWNPAKIAERSNIAAAEIRKWDPAAKIIVPLTEFDAPGQPKRIKFNSELISKLNFDVDGFAMHMYYDGYPGGPPIPRHLTVLDETIKQIQQISGKRKGVWLSEHGRWPEGDVDDKDWKNNWHKTNDIDGVISTADFILAASQLDGIEGLMLHAVKAGPWNIFNVQNGKLLGLTGVGELLEFMAPAFDGKRIETSTISTNISQYKGGYDVRGAAFSVNDKIHLIVVNRALSQLNFELKIDNAASGYKLVQTDSLRCEGDASYCQLPKPTSIAINSAIIDKDKSNHLGLSPKSVTYFIFEKVSSIK